VKQDRIILIGFMGSGKTTVGRLVAARLGWDFMDTDDLVEAQAGAPVARIFEDFGEHVFRDKEADALASLGSRARLVIATGGGAPVQPRNRNFFSGRVAIFHLRVSLQTARERTMANRLRPLLSLSEGALHSLYEQRQPLYNSMGKGVETEGRKPEQVAEDILAQLETQDSQSESED
jgi:shikimate kinase